MAPALPNCRAGCCWPPSREHSPRRSSARASRRCGRIRRRRASICSASNPFGTVSGGCNLAGWKFLNQNKTAWSAVPDPIGGPESGNCVAQLTDAASSTIAQTASRSLTLSPGFYSTRCNIATTDNNSRATVDSVCSCRQRHPADQRQAILRNQSERPYRGTASSLRTVVTAAARPTRLCINLLNPVATAVTNPNDCHTQRVGVDPRLSS